MNARIIHRITCNVLTCYGSICTVSLSVLTIDCATAFSLTGWLPFTGKGIALFRGYAVLSLTRIEERPHIVKAAQPRPRITESWKDPKTKQQPSAKKLWLEFYCAAYYPPPMFYKGPVYWWLTTRQHAWKWRELMRLIPAIEKRPVMRVSAVLRVVGAGGLPW